MQTNDIRVLVKEFRGKPFNDKLIADFCERHKIEATTAGNLEDYIYQQEYDERMAKTVPLVLAEIAKLNHIAEFETDETARKLSEENEEISLNISRIVEENGIEYREIGFLKTLGQDVLKICTDSENRLSNMGANVLAEMAIQYIGDPLTVYGLATKHREIANRKAEVLEAKPVQVEETKAEHVADEPEADTDEPETDEE